MEHHDFTTAVAHIQELWPKWAPNPTQLAAVEASCKALTREALWYSARKFYTAGKVIGNTPPIGHIIEDAKPKTESHRDNGPGMNPQEFAQHCQRIRDEDAEQDAMLSPFSEEQLRTMVIEAAKMEFVNKHGQTIRPFGWLAKVLLDAKRIGSLAKPSGKCNQDERLARNAAEWFCRGAHAKELPDLEAYRLEQAIKAQNRKQDGSPTPQVA